MSCCARAWIKEVNLPDSLPAFVDRVEARPAVRLDLQHEGLT
jgi:hypothetical protein